MAIGVLVVLTIIIANLCNLTDQSMTDKHKEMLGAQFYDGKKLNIPISKESGEQLHARWVNQALSSLISAIGQQQVGKLNEYHRNRLFKCSSNAERINDQARCVIDAIDSRQSILSDSKNESRLHKLKSLFDQKKDSVGKPFAQLNWKPNSSTKRSKKAVYRSRRSTIKRHNYKLQTEYDNITPFGVIGKLLSKTADSIKQKKQKTSWIAQVKEIEAIGQRHKAMQRLSDILKKRFNPSKHKKSSNMHNVNKTEMDILFDQFDATAQASLMHSDENGSQKSKQDAKVVRLFRDALKLSLKIGGDNDTKVANKTIRIGSPRFFAVSSDDNHDDEVRVLSPSLFSLHSKKKGLEALTSIPNLLKSSGTDDYNEWLNFIFEASGVNDAIQKIKANGIEPASSAQMPVGIDNQPLYFTMDNMTSIDPEQARKAKIIERITRSLTKKQLLDFNTTGYSVLTADQLAMVYGPHSPFNDTKRLNYFQTLNENDIQTHVLNFIRHLAGGESDRFKIRHKRNGIVLTPVFGDSIISDGEEASRPIILSPIVATLLLFSPSLMGPVILSPWLFVAVLIAPRMMSPLVLSPAAISTIILSPLVMNPHILSPGALVPFILSPILLGPFILSPGILSPLILNPFALAPAVFSPTIASAVVLSPFVLSPMIWSPPIYTALIFSPHAFSPLVNSTPIKLTSIFSPSFFS